MAGADARVLLGDVEQLRHRARRDRHTASAPLLLGGGLIVGSAPLLSWDAWGFVGFPNWYWLVAGPVAVLLLNLLYRRQRSRTGIGSGFRWPAAMLGALGLAAVLAFEPIAFFAFWILAIGLLIAGAVRRSWRQAAAGLAVLLGSPLLSIGVFYAISFVHSPAGFVGVGLLALGVWQRDGFLAGTAAAFTALAVLDRFTDRALSRLGVPDEVPAEVLVQVALGLLLIGAGVLALRREQMAA